MALTKCKECRKDISSEAESCPHCGFKPKRTSLFTWIVGGLFAIGVFGGIIRSNTDEGRASRAAPAATREPPDLRRLAAGGCREFIKQRLHDPASAQFGTNDEASVEVRGNRALVVRSVRAKNAIGALRLTEFVCVLELEGSNVRAIVVAERGRASPQEQALLDGWLRAGK